MRRYSNSVSSVTTGIPVYQAQIRVLKADTSAAQLYSDNGITTLSQPVLSDGTGFFSFFVADGTYTIVIADPDGSNPRSFPNTEIYEDARNVSVPVGEAGLTLPSAAARVGKVLGFDSSGNPVASTYDAGGAATAAAASAAAAVVSATSAAGSATSAGTSATTAAAARDAAILAAATSGVYPNSAASNVPRGLTQASVGAITAGSGGTNGTFALAWSSGNFSINPTGTFTVAGGALTAVTITGPGLYIGASPTVPTPSFAASAGLGGGAAVVLTAQFLVTNGSGYWVQSADNTELDRYANVSGVATAVAGVGPIPIIASTSIAAAIATERATRFTNSVKDAARDATAIKLLLTRDGTKTYKAGSTTEIDEIAGLIGGPATNVGYVTWSGAGGAAPNFPLRPIENTTGLQFTRETGFIVTTGLVANNSNFCIEMVLRFPAVAATFASKAAMDAAVATYKVGEIVQITGGPNTNLVNDIPSSSFQSAQLSAGEFTAGYWIKGNATFARLSQSYLLGSADAGGTKYTLVYVDNRGQLVMAGYDGTNQPFMRTILENVFALGQTGPVQIRLDCDGTKHTLWVNGEQSDEHYVVSTFVPAYLTVNGFSRTVGAGTSAAAVGGISFTLDALCVTTGLDYVARKDVSNAIARTFGTPLQKYSDIAYIIVHDDQSRTASSGPATAGDALRPDPTTNWNGELSKDAPTSGLYYAPTQERIKGVFTFAGATASDRIGPLCAYSDNSGGPVGRYTLSGTGGETHEFGMAKQLKLAETVRNSDLYMVAVTIGGYSLDLIKQKSTPPTYLYDLLSVAATGPVAGMMPREQLLRAVASVAKRCRSQGQKLRLMAITHLQGETTTTASGYTSATMGTAYYDDIIDLYTNDLKYLLDTSGQTPVMVKKGLGYAFDGVSNTCNVAFNDYRDDQFRRLEGSRSTIFRYCLFGGYANRFGRWIHPTTLAQREMGEGLGDLIRREYFEETTSSRAPQILSWVRSGANLVGTCNVAIQQINAKQPMFPGVHTTGGFNTFGLVLEPVSGGRTINGNVTWANSGTGGVGVITVPVSGGGPLAGDRINNTGTNAYYTNLYSATTRTGLFTSMNWPAFPLATANPAIDPTGPLNDLTEPLAASSHVVT